MSKRHTHVKKSAKEKRKRSPRVSLKKSPKKSPANRRPKHPKNPKGNLSKRIHTSKVVPKTRVVSKTKKPVKPVRRNPPVRTTVKRRRSDTTNTKRRGKVSKAIKRSKKFIRKGYEQKVSKRQVRLRQNEVTDYGRGKDTAKGKLETSKNFRHDKEGKRVKEKNIPGYRKYYRIDLRRGNFESHLDEIRTGNFDFIDEGLTRNKVGKGSKEPRAVIITIETSYRGTKHYHRKISDITFIVKKSNVKQLILDRMVELQDNWIDRADEEGEEYLEGSGKAFAPKNISAVMIEFVY